MGAVSLASSVIDEPTVSAGRLREHPESYQQSSVPASHQQSLKQLDIEQINMKDESEYKRLASIINPCIKEEVYGSSSRTNTVSQTEVYRPSTI